MNINIFILFSSVIVLMCIAYFIMTQQENFVNITIPQKKIDRKIVVSLTTSPLRLKTIDTIIKNMEKQTLKPDVIHLNIPQYFKRNCDKYDESLLNKLKAEHSSLNINRCDDYGPITKLLPTLKVETNPDTLIIVIDDDEEYENILIEKLVVQFLENPSVALCNDVNNYPDTFKVSVPGVFAGLIISRNMIDDNIFDFVDKTNLYKHCYNSDDLILGLYFKNNNIILEQPKITTNNKEIYGGGKDALKFQDNITYHGPRYTLCKKYIDTML